MAIIEVNSHKLPLNEKEYLNIKSLLPKLQKEFPLQDYTIDHLKLNGEKIIQEEDPRLVRPIEREDHIEVSFHQKKSIYQIMAQELMELSDKIIKKVKSISNELDNSDQIDLAQMSLVIDALDLFIKGVNHTSSVILKNNQDLRDSLPIKELQIHLLSIIKAIREAYMSEDFIMLTDLLEYELNDNLTQWKILILPTLKQCESLSSSSQKSLQI